jgi:hypothetical protein
MCKRGPNCFERLNEFFGALEAPGRLFAKSAAQDQAQWP